MHTLSEGGDAGTEAPAGLISGSFPFAGTLEGAEGGTEGEEEGSEGEAEGAEEGVEEGAEEGGAFSLLTQQPIFWYSICFEKE